VTPGKYGGWLTGWDPSELRGRGRKLGTIISGTVIMNEGHLNDYIGSSGWDFNMPWLYNRSGYTNPDNAFFDVYGTDFRHNNGANFLFIDGSVTRYMLGTRFDSDWKPIK
jgi:prepilin-type processing-associated H-X9-DG protein